MGRKSASAQPNTLCSQLPPFLPFWKVPHLNVNGDYLFAESMGFKHRRTYREWSEKKDMEMLERRKVCSSVMKEKDREERMRKRLNEERFNEWMQTRGNRKVVMLGRERREEDEKNVEESRRVKVGGGGGGMPRCLFILRTSCLKGCFFSFSNFPSFIIIHFISFPLLFFVFIFLPSVRILTKS